MRDIIEQFDNGEEYYPKYWNFAYGSALTEAMFEKREPPVFQIDINLKNALWSMMKPEPECNEFGIREMTKEEKDELDALWEKRYDKFIEVQSRKMKDGTI